MLTLSMTSFCQWLSNVYDATSRVSRRRSSHKPDIGSKTRVLRNNLIFFRPYIVGIFQWFCHMHSGRYSGLQVHDWLEILSGSPSRRAARQPHLNPAHQNHECPDQHWPHPGLWPWEHSMENSLAGVCDDNFKYEIEKKRNRKNPDVT